MKATPALPCSYVVKSASKRAYAPGRRKTSSKLGSSGGRAPQIAGQRKIMQLGGRDASNPGILTISYLPVSGFAGADHSSPNACPSAGRWHMLSVVPLWSEHRLPVHLAEVRDLQRA